jgi:ABC-2 type transport system permease protein
MNPVIIVGRSMFLRMIRDLPSLGILLGVPLILIPILGSVFSWIPADIPYLRGVSSPMAFFAFGLLIMFQLYGGGYSLTYVKSAFLSPMQWRLHSLPCEPGAIVLGVVGAATIFSLCQGLLIVAISRIVLGVRWGNLPVVFLVLLGVSLLSQLVYLTLLLALRSQSAATSLGWLYAYGSCILGGLIFPLPVEKPFFHFMVTYGNPYSVAQTAIRESAPGGSPATAALCIAVLCIAAALFAAIAAWLGSKKLA